MKFVTTQVVAKCVAHTLLYTESCATSILSAHIGEHNEVCREVYSLGYSNAHTLKCIVAYQIVCNFVHGQRVV